MEKLSKVLGNLAAFALIGLIIMMFAIGGKFEDAHPSDRQVITVLFWLMVGFFVLSSALSDGKKGDK